jgi:hypothetical protein
MKLDYVIDRSRDFFLVRLYECNQAEARSLKNIVRSIVSGECHSVALQDESWIESVGRCELILRRGSRNRGIREVAPLNFECVLNSDGWSNVEALLNSFCEAHSAGFQWLEREGRVGLLISKTGQWQNAYAPRFR